MSSIERALTDATNLYDLFMKDGGVVRPWTRRAASVLFKRAKQMFFAHFTTFVEQSSPPAIAWFIASLCSADVQQEQKLCVDLYPEHVMSECKALTPLDVSTHFAWKILADSDLDPWYVQRCCCHWFWMDRVSSLLSSAHSMPDDLQEHVPKMAVLLRSITAQYLKNENLLVLAAGFGRRNSTPIGTSMMKSYVDSMGLMDVECEVMTPDAILHANKLAKTRPDDGKAAPYLKELWQLFVFGKWFEDHTLEKTKWCDLYLIEWSDLGLRKHVSLLEERKRNGHKRRPIIICYGQRAWFIQESDGRYTHTTSLAAALVVWSALIMEKFDATLEDESYLPKELQNRVEDADMV